MMTARHTLRYVPVDFLMVAPRAETLAECLEALRWCDRVCTLVSVQAYRVKRTSFLKVALLEHCFTRVVPVPRARTSAHWPKACAWAGEPILYGQQLDGLLLLQRLIEHFAAAALSLQATRAFDAVRVIVPATMAAIADTLARRVAEDEPSYLSAHLAGHAGRAGGLGYGLSAGPLGLQSETIEAHRPELSVARTAVLDYFGAMVGAEKIFAWEAGQGRDAANLDGLVKGLCDELAWNPSPSLRPQYACYRSLLLMKNLPEWAPLRDVAFYAKFFLNTNLRAFPEAARDGADAKYAQRDAELSWGFDDKSQQFVVSAFGRVLACASTRRHRFPSSAQPSFYTRPHAVETEDDILHVRTLPSFRDALGQHDAELLLSYLTVPYIRLALVVHFFASEDRVHALRSPELQGILDAVLFEPGRYLDIGMNHRVPSHVPARDADKLLLATPYGHLLNELHRAPNVVCESVLSLLRLALDLDGGTVRATTVPIILYVARLACRVDAHLDFAVRHADGDLPGVQTPLRDVTFGAAALAAVRKARAELHVLLRGAVHVMIEAWISELMREVGRRRCRFGPKNDVIFGDWYVTNRPVYDY